MTDSRTGLTNQAFECGIARIEELLFKNFRQDQRKKNIEVTNLDLDRIQKEFNLKTGQVRTLPSLFKSIMEKMILDESFKEVLPEDHKGFALGACEMYFEFILVMSRFFLIVAMLNWNFLIVRLRTYRHSWSISRRKAGEWRVCFVHLPERSASLEIDLLKGLNDYCLFFFVLQYEAIQY